MDQISIIYITLSVLAILTYLVILRPNLKEQERIAKKKSLNKKS